MLFGIDFNSSSLFIDISKICTKQLGGLFREANCFFTKVQQIEIVGLIFDHSNTCPLLQDQKKKITGHNHQLSTLLHIRMDPVSPQL